MSHLQFLNDLSQLRLDIVGIVAVLGEGCTSRTLQVSALSWPHVFPRLLPAPQALLVHQQQSRLPVQDGIVIGAYSGNTKHELNFFCQLLHGHPPESNKVELLEVKARTDKPRSDGQAFGVKHVGWLPLLSGLGCAMAAALIGMSIHYEDGFALVATIALAATSSIAGIASWWNLKFEEEKPKAERKDVIPDSDVVIYYPNGAFRIVRCSEQIARLYFKREVCEHFANDNQYRSMALIASIFLMGGLLCMGNAEPILQIAFAAFYISLNVLHWAVSALNPLHYHWEHSYMVKPIPFNAPLKKKKQIDDNVNKPEKGTTNSTSSKIKSNGTSGTPIDDNDHTEAKSSISTIRPVNRDVNGDPVPGLKQRRTGTISFEPESMPKNSNGFRLRRNQTDLEGNKQRQMTPRSTRSFSFPQTTPASLIRRLSSFRSGEKEAASEEEDRRFTAALWQAIALTGTGRWLKNTHIAPNTDVWEKWIKMATSRAVPREARIANESGEIERPKNDRDKVFIPATTKDKTGAINLPPWQYQEALTMLLEDEKNLVKQRPPPPKVLSEPDIAKLSPDVRTRLGQLAQIARDRVKIRHAVHAFRNPLWLRKEPSPRATTNGTT